MSIEEEAKRHFSAGYNCAESVLLALSKRSGFTGQALASVIPRIATGFGGGIARNGDVCGALVGGIMAISLSLGRDRSDASRDPCYRAVDEFYNEFVETFGTCKCRQITGVDLKTSEGFEEHKKRIHGEICDPIVAWTVKKAYRILKDQ